MRKPSFALSRLSRRLILATLLGALVLGCIQSGTDRAGWSWPASWWGTSSARAAAINAAAQGYGRTAIRSAEIGLLHAPVDRLSASILAEALLLNGESERSAHAYSLGVATGWRDREAQRWAAETAASNGNWDQAAVHLDALLRTSPQGQMPTRWFIGIERHARGRSALASRLSESPHWSEEWIRGSGDLPADAIPNRIRSLTLARSLGLQVSKYAAAGATWKMLKKHPEQSFPLWVALVGPGESTKLGIWDANFRRSDLSRSSSPFEWRRTDATGAQIEIDAREQVPRLTFSRIGVATGKLIETYLPISPGHYTLTWRQSGLMAPMNFQLSCGGSSGIVTSEGAFVKEDLYGFRFAVRPGCILPKLSLTADSHVPEQANHLVWALRIERDASI